MPVIILAGEEDFELGRRLTALKERLLEPAWVSVNFLRLANASLFDIIDAAHQLPFGPGNKLIVIDDCDLFTKKRTKGKDNEESKDKLSNKKEDSKKITYLDLLEQALAQLAPSTYLIFACPYNFDTTLKLSKLVSKFAQIEEFGKERYFVGSKNVKLETWCRKEAKRYGATIDDQALSYLLDGLEADLRQISQELAKATTYVLPKTHITLAVVQELTPYHSHIFVLADRWVSGRRDEAYASLKELLARQSGMPIIAALQTMLSRWIEIKSLSDKIHSELPGGPGLTKRELPFLDLARKIALTMKALPVVIEKDLKRITNQSCQGLISKKIELTRLEHLVKTGQMHEAHALEILLSK